MGDRTDIHAVSMSPQRLRVLLFSTQVNWGGGEEQARLTVRGLSAISCDVLTAAPAASILGSRLRQAGYPVFDVPRRGRGLSAWITLRRAIGWFRPHILFMNDPHAIIHGSIASLGLRVVRIGARRTVFRLRSGWLYRRMLDGIICGSQAAAKACHQAKIPAARIHVVYDGVDLSRIRAANADRGRRALDQMVKTDNSRCSLPLDSQSHKPLRFIVHVGKLTPAKGQDDLLTAFAGLADEFPDVMLVLIGEGETRAYLESRVASLGLKQRVFLPGFRDDALDYMAAADVFVFPSREEGLGGALVEALLLGVPTVAASAGGIPEILQGEPPLGRMVPPADPNALCTALREVLNLSEDQRRIAVDYARKTAEERFSDKRMAWELRDLFWRMAFTNNKTTSKEK